MYDKHKRCNDYYKYRAMLVKIYNGEKVRYSVAWLKNQIQISYDEGRLQGGQYDQLMGYIQSIDSF